MADKITGGSGKSSNKIDSQALAGMITSAINAGGNKTAKAKATMDLEIGVHYKSEKDLERIEEIKKLSKKNISLYTTKDDAKESLMKSGQAIRNKYAADKKITKTEANSFLKNLQQYLSLGGKLTDKDLKANKITATMRDDALEAVKKNVDQFDAEVKETISVFAKINDSLKGFTDEGLLRLAERGDLKGYKANKRYNESHVAREALKKGESVTSAGSTSGSGSGSGTGTGNGGSGGGTGTGSGNANFDGDALTEAVNKVTERVGEATAAVEQNTTAVNNLTDTFNKTKDAANNNENITSKNSSPQNVDRRAWLQSFKDNVDNGYDYGKSRTFSDKVGSWDGKLSSWAKTLSKSIDNNLANKEELRDFVRMYEELNGVLFVTGNNLKELRPEVTEFVESLYNTGRVAQSEILEGEEGIKNKLSTLIKSSKNELDAFKEQYDNVFKSQYKEDESKRKAESLEELYEVYKKISSYENTIQSNKGRTAEADVLATADAYEKMKQNLLDVNPLLKEYIEEQSKIGGDGKVLNADKFDAVFGKHFRDEQKYYQERYASIYDTNQNAVKEAQNVEELLTAYRTLLNFNDSIAASSKKEATAEQAKVAALSALKKQLLELNPQLAEYESHTRQAGKNPLELKNANWETTFKEAMAETFKAVDASKEDIASFAQELAGAGDVGVKAEEKKQEAIAETVNKISEERVAYERAIKLLEEYQSVRKGITFYPFVLPDENGEHSTLIHGGDTTKRSGYKNVTKAALKRKLDEYNDYGQKVDEKTSSDIGYRRLVAYTNALGDMEAAEKIFGSKHKELFEKIKQSIEEAKVSLDAYNKSEMILSAGISRLSDSGDIAKFDFGDRDSFQKLLNNSSVTDAVNYLIENCGYKIPEAMAKTEEATAEVVDKVEKVGEASREQASSSEQAATSEIDAANRVANAQTEVKQEAEKANEALREQGQIASGEDNKLLDFSNVETALSSIQELLDKISNQDFLVKVKKNGVKNLNEIIEKLNELAEKIRTTDTSTLFDVPDRTSLIEKIERASQTVQTRSTTKSNEIDNVIKLYEAVQYVNAAVALKNELFEAEANIVKNSVSSERKDLTGLISFVKGINSQIAVSMEELGKKTVEAAVSDARNNAAEEQIAEQRKAQSKALTNSVIANVKSVTKAREDALKRFRKISNEITEANRKQAESEAAANLARNQATKEAILSRRNSKKETDPKTVRANQIMAKMKTANQRLKEGSPVTVSSEQYSRWTKELEALGYNVEAVTGHYKNLAVAVEQVANAHKEVQHVAESNTVTDADKQALAEEKHRERVLTKISKLYANIAKTYERNSNYSNEASSSLRTYIEELRGMNGAFLKDANLDQVESRLRTIAEDFNRIQASEAAAGRSGKSFFGNMANQLSHLNAQFIAMYFSWMDWIRYARQGVEVIRELDDALAEMNKVSDESMSSLRNFQKASYDIASSIGSTGLQIQQSTADFMRLGKSLDQAQEFAKSANVLLNVSEIETIQEATEDLISATQAYKDDGPNTIIDVINNIGNNYSSSTADLAEGLKLVSGVLQSQKNDLNETVAMLTAADMIDQDMSRSARGVRMIALRITGSEEAKKELSDMGEEVDDFVVRTKAKSREIIQDYTAVASNAYKGVDILDANGQFKNTYTILKEIGEVYKEIQEEDKKFGTNRAQALIEVLAGKNRSNTAAALLNNVDTLKSVYESAQNSAGSAMEENEKYMQSIEGHLNGLTNTTQEFLANATNREFLNFWIDTAKAFVEVATSIEKVVGLAPMLATLFGVTQGARANFIGDFATLTSKNSQSQRNVFQAGRGALDLANVGREKADMLLLKDVDINAIRTYNETIMATGNAQAALTEATANANQATTQFITGASNLSKGMDQTAIKAGAANISMRSYSVATRMAAVSQTILNAAIGACIGLLVAIGISKAIEFFDHLINKEKYLKEAADEANTVIKTQIDHINELKGASKDLVDRYAELAQGVDQYTGANKKLTEGEYEEFISLSQQLAEILPELVVGYDALGNPILGLSGSVEEVTGKLNEFIKAAKEASVVEIQENLPDVIKQLDSQVSKQEEDPVYRDLEKVKELKDTLSTEGGVVLVDPEQINKVGDLLYEFQTYINSAGKDVRIGIDYQNNGLFFEGEDAKDFEENFDEYFSQYEQALVLKANKVESDVQKDINQISANLNQIVSTMDLPDVSKNFITAFINSGDWYDAYKEQGVLPENIGKWFTDNYIKGLLDTDLSVQKAITDVMSPDEYSIAEIKEKWDRIIEALGGLNNLPSTLRDLYDSTNTKMDVKRQSIADLFAGDNTLSRYGDLIDRMSAEDLNFAAELEVPDGTLNSWRELLSLMFDARKTAIEDEQEDVFDAAARNLNLDFSVDEDTGEVEALKDSIANWKTQNQELLDDAKQKLEEADRLYKEKATQYTSEELTTNYQNALSEYNDRLAEFEKQAVSAAKATALFEASVSDLSSNLSSYKDIIKASEGSQGELIKNSAQYSNAISKLSASLSGISGSAVDNTLAKEFIKSKKNAEQLEKAINGDDVALASVQKTLRLMVDASTDVRSAFSGILTDEQIEVTTGLDTSTFDEQFSSFYNYLEANRNLGEIQAQGYLDTQPFYTALNALLSAAPEAAAKLEGIFKGMGWDIEWEPFVSENIPVTTFNGETHKPETTTLQIRRPTQLRIKSIKNTGGSVPSHVSSSNSGGRGSGGSGGSGGGGGGNSKSEPTKTDFNWIERAIKKTTDAISKLQDIIANTWDTWSKRNKKINDEIDQTRILINQETKAQKSYKKAMDYISKGKNIDGSNNKEWKNLKGSKKWQNYTKLVRDGRIKAGKDLTTIADKEGSDFAGQLQAYMDWYDKIIESESNVRQHEQEIRDLIQQKYDNKITSIENRVERLETEAATATTIYETNARTNAVSRSDISSYYKGQEKSLTKQGNLIQKKINTINNEIAEMEKNGLKKTSQQYQELLNQRAQYEQELADNQSQQVENAIAMGQAFVDRLKTIYDDISTIQNHQLNMLNNYSSLVTAQGQLMSQNMFKQIGDIYEKQINEAVNESKKLWNTIQSNLNSGLWTADTDEYKTAMQEYYSLNEQIVSLETQRLNNLEAAKQAELEIYHLKQDYISDLQKETDLYRNLLSIEHELYDTGTKSSPGTGRMNSYGTAYASTYAIDYNAYMQQAEMAKQKLKEYEETADKSNKNDIERLRTLTSEWQNYVTQAENAKKANQSFFISMYQEMLKSLQALINKRKEALQAAKNEYDYNKKIKDQVKDITVLRKQLAVYQGDDSEENRARVQKLQVQLKNAEESLEESEYEKWISDTSDMLDDIYDQFEELYDILGKDIDGRMQETINSLNSNSEQIQSTISSELTAVGGTISSEMNSIFGGSSDIASFFGANGQFEVGNTNIIKAINNIELKVDGLVTAMGDVASAYNEAVNNGTMGDTGIGSNNGWIAPLDSSSLSDIIKDVTAAGGGIAAGGAMWNDINWNTSNTKDLNASSFESKLVSSNNSKNTNTKETTSNSNKTWFKSIFGKNPKATSTANSDTSIIAKLAHWGVSDTSLATRAKYYKAMGKSDKYTGSTSQNTYMINQMKKHGYSKGGSIASLINSSGEDGIAFVRKGEYILTPDMLKDVLGIVNPLKDMADNKTSLSNNNVNVGGIEVQITLPNVSNYDEFKQKLTADKQFERVIQQATLGNALGKNSLKKYSI